MSFLFKVSDYINPQIVLCLNDIIFLMIISFYLGRIYQSYKFHSCRVIVNIYQQNEEEKNNQSKANQFNNSYDLSKSLMMNQQKVIQTQLSDKKNDNKQISQIQSNNNQSITEIQLNQIIQQNQLINNNNNNNNKILQNKLIIPQLQNNLYNHNQSSQFITKTINKIKNSQKQNTFINTNNNQFLLEKIKLDGQKIQQRGKFQLLFQKNKNNCSLIRKIQKHQIITDYLLKNQLSTSHYRQLIPLKKQSTFPNQNSVIQVQYYQNYQTNTPTLPIITKQIYELTQKSQGILNLFFQHGKFRKIYRSIQKIGEGAFGTVYEAYNMIECKKYAIKKIFINKNSKQIQNLLNQIKILNNLSHPNIINYNTCWLQYAQLNQHTSYQKLVQQMIKREQQQLNKKQPISIKLLQDYQQQNQQKQQQQLQQSYHSEKNSGFSFIHSSRSNTKKSNKLLTKQNIQKIFHDFQIQQPTPITNTTSNNFGLIPIMYIQMQLCQHSLSYYLRKRYNIDRIFAFNIINQLINGVCYIHTNRVVHRDLKPQNILFVAKNGQIAVKIGDFGLAINIASKEKNTQKFLINNTRVGTPSYIAPELYRDSLKKLTEEDLQKSDIYSLAVIYYEILNRFTTTHERGQKLSFLKQGKVVGINEYKQQKKLIQELIKQNRPKSKDICKLSSYIKLFHTINNIKKYKYKSKQPSINNNNNISSKQFNKFINLQQNILKNNQVNQKQLLQNKQKTNNKLTKYNNKINKQSHNHINNLINNYYNQQNSCQQLYKQNYDQINQQMYQTNIELIRRTSESDRNTDNSKANKNKIVKQIKLNHEHKTNKFHEESNSNFQIFEEPLSQSFQFNDDQNDDNNKLKVNKYSNAIIKL